MELFAMGAGNYSEEDVRQGALALTGWQLPRPDSTAPANGTGRMLPVYASQKSGVFNQRRAFKGSVTYLGKTGALDTQGVIDRILAQPATAPFVTTKVLQHFVTAQPASSLVTRLAGAFRHSNYDMKTLMRAVFTSDEFPGRRHVSSAGQVTDGVHGSGRSRSRRDEAFEAHRGVGLRHGPDTLRSARRRWMAEQRGMDLVEHRDRARHFVTAALAQATSVPPSSEAVTSA
jgi:hypothetical protein